MKSKNRLNKIIRYFLFFLFLGYYGCITLFTHTHHIENGIIIVHSHPFRSGTGTNPLNHHHTSEGYVLIHYLTTFLTSILFIGSAIEAYKHVSQKIKFQKAEDNFFYPASLFPYGLRAPPLKYTC